MEPARRSTTRTERAAFTLLEVMIALVLLVALSALVLPSMLGMSDEVTFREACKQAASSVAMARAQALRDGKPMRLWVVRNGEGRIELRGALADTKRPADSPTDADGQQGDSERRVIDRAAKVDRAADSEVYLTLPRGCGWTDVQPRGAASGARPVTESLTSSPSADSVPATDAATGASATEVFVVVLLPSGGATVKGVTYVTGAGGRLASVKINRWTGEARVEAMAAADESNPDAEKKPESATKPEITPEESP